MGARGQETDLDWSDTLIRPTSAFAILMILLSMAQAADMTEIKVGYLHGAQHRATISLLDLPSENDGLAGAQLAIDDNNTTGSFLAQRFSLEEIRLKEADDPASAVTSLADRGISLVIADLPADALIKAADAGRERGQ